MKPIPLCSAAIAVLALGGCAALTTPSFAPGTSAADVQARYGKPTDVRTVNGRPAWDYVQGPEGFQTYRVNFDAGDRVRSVEPLLTEKGFREFKPGSPRESIAATFGRPLQVQQYPRIKSEVWTYRYKDVTMEMLADVHVSIPDGKVVYTTMYRDPAFTNSLSN